MEVSEFGRGLQRYWAVLVLTTLLGCIGAFVYDYYFLLDEAQATVAVLDPLATRTAGFGEAQVTFDSIIKSKALADVVAARMGESPDTVQNDLSVTLATQLSPANPSPLYVVHGKDHGVERAIQLTNTAVSVARNMYASFNSADGSNIKQATSSEAQDAQTQLKSAQDALNSWATANSAVNLPGRLDSEQAKVASLQQQLYAAQAEMSGDYYVSSILYTKESHLVASLQASLSSEQSELDRLLGLAPEYSRLEFNIEAAQARVNQISQAQETQVVNQLMPTTTELKQVDLGYRENQFLYRILIYSLGLLCGVILGLLAVYILLLGRGRPATPAELAEAFGAPVLVRLGKATS